LYTVDIPVTIEWDIHSGKTQGLFTGPAHTAVVSQIKVVGNLLSYLYSIAPDQTMGLI